MTQTSAVIRTHPPPILPQNTQTHPYTRNTRTEKRDQPNKRTQREPTNLLLVKHDRGHVIPSVVELLERGLKDDVLPDVLDQIQLARRLEDEADVLRRRGGFTRRFSFRMGGLVGGMTEK